MLRWLIAHHAVLVADETTPPWRTRCDDCGTPLWPRACGPRATCPVCRHAGGRGRVGAPPWTVEIAVVALAAILVLSHLTGWELAAVTWWSTAALVLSAVDGLSHRLPLRLVGPTTAGTLLLLTAAAASTSHWGRLLQAILGGLALAAALSVVALLSQRGLGLGDATVGAPIGLLLVWWGWPALLVGLVWIALLSLVAGLALLAARRATWKTPLPYGPILCAGMLIGVVHVSW